MKKVTKRSENEVTVKIGRATEPIEEITLPVGSTIENALEETDISIRSAESLWVDGERADLTDEIEDGDVIQITGKKEGGR